MDKCEAKVLHLDFWVKAEHAFGCLSVLCSDSVRSSLQRGFCLPPTFCRTLLKSCILESPCFFRIYSSLAGHSLTNSDEPKICGIDITLNQTYCIIFDFCLKIILKSFYYFESYCNNDFTFVVLFAL